MSEAATHEMVVKQGLEIVAEVREFVRLVVGQWGIDDFVPCLVASELVTNALRHAAQEDGDVALRLGLGEDEAVWMEVQDGTSKLPQMREADMISEVGRGLMIVDYFTRCWGVRPLGNDAGKVVFAVIDPGVEA
jgi:two-component sensor histidine kinase